MNRRTEITIVTEDFEVDQKLTEDELYHAVIQEVKRIVKGHLDPTEIRFLNSRLDPDTIRILAFEKRDDGSKEIGIG